VTVIAAIFWAVVTIIAGLIGVLVILAIGLVVMVWEWLTAFYRWLRVTTPILRYLVTGYCGYIGCGYVEPYGFVPEAGCPVHDADTRLSRWVRKVRREQSRWKRRL